MYIKINGKTKHYAVTVEPFTTQHGKKAIRFVGGNVPDTDKGFKYYNDNGTEVLDLSAYIYLYRSNEYTMEQDNIVLPSGNKKPLPPNPIDIRFANVNARINAVTPYEQTKKAYYGENEKVFYGVPNGNTTIFFDNYTGEYDTSRIEDRLTVSFPERLKDMTNITVMVQR